MDEKTKGTTATEPKPTDFIREFVKEDLKNGRFITICTRYPPEPNAMIHIGHAKNVWINYGIARDFGGKFNLRFDDTNPTREEQEYVDAIIADVRWLGADFGDRIFFGSDYFEQQYQWAEELVKKGLAYVCDLSPEEVTAHRGTLTEPGRNSPFRNRPVDENLDLFRRMRAGEFPDGAKTLRAKIDMASPNLNLRDPVMYRILHVAHHRQGDKWCIYPMYDWAHGLQDSIEGISHSICSLEYEDHRPLYNWFIDAVNRDRTDNGSGPWGRKIHHARQIEYARLNLTYTVMSKRLFLELAQKGVIDSFDDPRLPTIAGLRRRGFTAGSIREFCARIGIDKTYNVIDYALLEFCIREELNKTARRAMAVLRPLKLIIDNYPADKIEDFESENNPEDPAAGTRKIQFSRELYVERDDYMEQPAKGYFRLFPGSEVRLKHAYLVKCGAAVKDKDGNVVELHCTYDPQSRGGNAPDGRKIKGTLHWVSARHAADAEVRLYEQLFTEPKPTTDSPVNPNSLAVLTGCKVESSLQQAKPGDTFQFLRHAYFCADSNDHKNGKLVFNRTVTLRDSWAKEQKK